MHPGIELQVNPDFILYRGLVVLHRFNEQPENPEMINFRLQIIFQEQIEAILFRTHDQDRQPDSRLAQLNPFVGISYGKIVDVVKLQNVRDLIASAAVRESLDHRHDPGSGPEAGAVMVQVMDQCVEVDLHHGFVGLLLELPADLFKLKDSCAFQENRLMLERGERELLQELVGGGEKPSLHPEKAGVPDHVAADADHPRDVSGFKHGGNFTVQFLPDPSRLQDIGKDYAFFLMLVLLI